MDPSRVSIEASLGISTLPVVEKIHLDNYRRGSVVLCIMYEN